MNLRRVLQAQYSMGVALQEYKFHKSYIETAILLWRATLMADRWLSTPGQQPTSSECATNRGKQGYHWHNCSSRTSMAITEARTILAYSL